MAVGKNICKCEKTYVTWGGPEYCPGVRPLDFLWTFLKSTCSVKNVQIHSRDWTDFEFSGFCFFVNTPCSRFSYKKNVFRLRIITRVGALQIPDVEKAYQFLRHVCATSRFF